MGQDAHTAASDSVPSIKDAFYNAFNAEEAQIALQYREQSPRIHVDPSNTVALLPSDATWLGSIDIEEYEHMQYCVRAERDSTECIKFVHGDRHVCIDREKWAWVYAFVAQYGHPRNIYVPPQPYKPVLVDVPDTDWQIAVCPMIEGDD